LRANGVIFRDFVRYYYRRRYIAVGRIEAAMTARAVRAAERSLADEVIRKRSTATSIRQALPDRCG
jgi:hypothetical protein